MRKSGCCLLIASLLFHVASIRAHQDSANTHTNGTDRIPFQLGAGHLILIEGRIDKLENLKFLVDTGATQTVVDRRIAKALELAREPGRVFRFQKYVPVEWAVFSKVQFGPIEVHKARLMVGEVLQPLKSVANVDAIIGLDLLGMSSGFLLDYGTKTISFRTAPVLQSKELTCLTAKVFLQGQPVNLVADTGMHGILLYEDSLRMRVPRLRLSEERREVRIGSMRGKQAQMAGVRLGASESETTVYLIKRPSNGVPANIDGYFGMDALNARVVEFDFEAKRLRWE